MKIWRASHEYLEEKRKERKKGCRLCIRGQAITRAAKEGKEGQDKLNDTVE